MSTKLKLLGVDVASFGDAMGAHAGRLEVVVNDPVKRTYAKLVALRRRQDAARRHPGRRRVGVRRRCGRWSASELPGDPLALIAPAGPTARADLGVGALPDDAQICSCNNVQGPICGGHQPRAACDVAALKDCTTAGTVVRSCVPTAQAAARRPRASSSPRRCASTSRSRRAELFEIVARDRRSAPSPGSIERYGTRHAAATSASPPSPRSWPRRAREHMLDGEQAALQDTNDHFLANIQKNGTYSVVPRMPGGEITPEQLIVIGEVARDFGLYTKITGGQRIDLFGARVEQLPAIWQRLVDGGHGVRARLRQVAAHGEVAASARLVPLRRAGLGAAWPIDLELRYRGLRSPHKIKFGVSGLRARVRRGARQGRRRHRHRERLEPLRRRQRRHDARGTPSCWPATSTTRRWSATSTAS